MKTRMPHSRSPRNVAGRAAFTLVELLVAVAIIALLAAGGAGLYQKTMDSAGAARETNAGRILISAYLQYAADHDGQLMVAHYEGQVASGEIEEAVLPGGQTLGAEVLHRYPYRLAPYFDYRMDGTILVNENRREIAKIGFPSAEYGNSLCPAFGINYYFVGGYKVDNVLAGADDCATRLSQVTRPSSLLVFATAFQNIGSERVAGRYGVEPPQYRTQLWDENLHVDARHHGKALCAFLDGTLRSLAIEELRDMRLWSRRAAELDDPDYLVAAQSSGGIGGGGGGRR